MNPWAGDYGLMRHRPHTNRSRNEGHGLNLARPSAHRRGELGFPELVFNGLEV
jgi:hypothetical protein